MKTIGFTLIALLTASSLFAQSEGEKWNVYDIQTAQETVVSVANFIPAAIVGEDDRINITGRAADFEKAAVVLEMQNKQGHKSLCSGTMIGKNLVLTAAHCLISNGDYHKSIWVFATGLPERKVHLPPSAHHPQSPNRTHSNGNHNDSLPQWIRGQKIEFSSLPFNDQIFHAINMQRNTASVFPSAMAAKLWVPAEWNDRKPLMQVEPFDYGLIFLDSNLGELTGWMNIASKSNWELQTQKIILLGRGGDKSRRTLWKAKGTVGKITANYLYHNADMVGGNSGGPVILEKDPFTIVALNNFARLYPHNQAPEGTFPNGSLRISNKIINAVRYHRNKF